MTNGNIVLASVIDSAVIRPSKTSGKCVPCSESRQETTGSFFIIMAKAYPNRRRMEKSGSSTKAIHSIFQCPFTIFNRGSNGQLYMFGNLIRQNLL